MMTNFQKIKQMNIEELAKLLADTFPSCMFCEAYIDGECDNRCVKAQKKWLESEAVEI